MAVPEVELDVRTRLRECALELFGRRSVRETSTREILAATGLRNPSAISYHFGSKQALVEDLVAELVGRSPVMRSQVESEMGLVPPTIEPWVAVVADSATELLSTERGCCQARLWAEYALTIRPHVVEDFLISGDPLATAWSRVAVRTLPHLHGYIAIARNVAMLRTVEFMTARRAERLLHNDEVLVADPVAFRTMLVEIAAGILTAPSSLTDEDVASNSPRR